MQKMEEKEVVVVGGGMVGAALALGLAQQGRQVVLIEKNQPDFSASIFPDNRISAISYGSVKLLTSLGVWSDELAARAEPYQRLETWEWPSAKVTFDASLLKIEQLGFMVENRLLQKAIWQKLQQYAHVEWRIGEQISTIQPDQHRWQLTVKGEQEVSLSCSLLCGCDGAHSMIKQSAMIGATSWQYRQACLLITVQGRYLEKGVTWQQFHPSGPRAYLPLTGDWACLVWYDTPKKIRYLSQLPLPQLAEQIERHFPERLPKVTPVQAAYFPLTRQHCQQYIKQGLVLVGDAAHTIHPLAGQGVNLGYRDVACLLNRLQGIAITDAERLQAALQDYQRQRYRDNVLMQSSMDLFYAGFSHPSGIGRVFRNLSLLAAERLPLVAKRQILRYALGGF